MREPLPPRVRKLDPPMLKDKRHPEYGTYAYVLAWRDTQGKVRRRFFVNKVKADAECRKLTLAMGEAGKGVLSLRPGDAEAIEEARRLLEPFGEDFLDVIREYAKRKEAASASVSVEDAVARFVEAKRGEGLRPRYVEDLKNRLGVFAKAFAGRRLSDLSALQLSDWITSLPGGALNKRTFRLRLSALFNWAARRAWCQKSIMADVESPKLRPCKTEVFPPEEVRMLLETASKDAPALVPYLALGFFAGLRTAELDRLDWADVNGEVRIEAGVAKTASRRVIPILPNLAAWIAPHRRKAGSVRPANAKRLLARVLRASDVTWKANGMRHSFASYRLAATQDAPKVSLELGHMSPALVFRHYRALVREEDAGRYFSITPETESKVIAFRREATA